MLRLHTIRDRLLSWRFFLYTKHLIEVDKNGRTVRDHDLRRVAVVEFGLFKTRTLSLGFSSGGESDHDPMVSIHIPFLFYLYVGLPFIPFRRWKGERRSEISLSFFDHCTEDIILRISPWDSNEWTRGGPWWRNGKSFYLFDILLGRHKYHSEQIFADDVPLFFPESEPEGTMPATVEVSVDTWKRPRWPWWPFTSQVLRAHVKPEKPLPLVYKDDSVWESTAPIHNFPIPLARRIPAVAACSGAAQFVASLVKDRKRR